MGDRFSEFQETNPGDLVSQFKNAFASESLDVMAECLSEFEQSVQKGKPSGASLFRIIPELIALFTLHEDVLCQWFDDDPELQEQFDQLIAEFKRVLSADDTNNEEQTP